MKKKNKIHPSDNKETKNIVKVTCCYVCIFGAFF